MTLHLRFVFGDQLTRSPSALRDIDPALDVVVMIEAAAKALNVPHHKPNRPRAVIYAPLCSQPAGRGLAS